MKPSRLVLVLSVFVVGTTLPGASAAKFPPVIDLSQSDGDVVVRGAFALDDSGRRVATGDVNGDGAVDLVILSPNASPFGREDAGRIDIVWGPISRDSLFDLLDCPDVTRILGSSDDDALFSDIACADLNADGCDDVVFGIAWQNIAEDDDGRAHIIFGSSALPDSIDLDSQPPGVTTIDGETGSYGFLGAELTTGDVDNDGFTDLILGAPALWPGGVVYIVSGRDSFPASIDLGIELSGVIRVIDPGFQHASGAGLDCGDVDGDGYADVLIGSPGNNPATNMGEATLLYGSDDLPDTVYFSDNTVRMTHFNPVPQHTVGQLGEHVALADMDGDSILEVILAAHTASPPGCLECGEIYVVPWSDDLPDVVELASDDHVIMRMIGGAGIGRTSGAELAGGDVDGDGLDDLVVFSRYQSGSTPYQSTITVVYGASSFPDTLFLAVDTTVSRIYGDIPPDETGVSMAIDDVNGDGVQDLVAGGHAASPLGRLNAGETNVFYGSRTPTGVAPLRNPVVPSLRNYPNPFSEFTTIEYVLPAGSDVTIAVYNVRGQLVYSSSQSRRPAGTNTFQWTGVDRTGRRAPSGIYFYRVEFPGQAALTRKAVLLR